MTERAHDPEFMERVQERRQRRMAGIDKLPPELRALVHEYGYPVVHTCLCLQLTKPQQIRHLIETILNELSPTRGSYSSQGPTSTRFPPKDTA